MKSRFDSTDKIVVGALIAYALVATILIVFGGSQLYRTTHQQPEVVTKTRVVKQKSKTVSSDSPSLETAKPDQNSSEEALSSYKTSEQKLKNTAIKYAKILENYSPSIASKRAALKGVATPDQINQLAPEAPNTQGQAKADAYEIEWNTITAMIEPGTNDDGLATVHMTYAYSYDQSHTMYNTVLLLRFDNGLVSHSQLFTGVQSQSGTDQ